MSFDTFKAEKEVLDRGRTCLQAVDGDFRAEYQDLLDHYGKLLRSSQRLVRMSDRSEVNLKNANQRIREQQAELAAAHRKLEQHAELLEDRVKQRTRELVLAQAKLHRLVSLGIALSAERSHTAFMELVLNGARELTGADGGMLFELTQDGTALGHALVAIDSLDLRLGGATGHDHALPAVSLRERLSDRPAFHNVIAHACLTERPVNVPNVIDCMDFDCSDLVQFDTAYGYRTMSLLAVPLKPRHHQVDGVLVLLNARALGTGRIIAFDEESEGFVEALASQAAVAGDNRSLLKAQEDLFDAIIKMIAGAIDAKSPYTHGHCMRVPEIAGLLAQAACDTEDGPLADFDMSPAHWREFHLAGWLHDCGKVTTPEYVIDKATKLETIHNRIHEIRTRFEVKRRDLEIDYLRACLTGVTPEPELAAAREHRIAQLHDDFAFVAGCNIGGEAMGAEQIERLGRIAVTPWTRYFDDRLGVSEAEKLRLQGIPPRPLPVQEMLIADRPEHLVPRPEGRLPYDPAAHGFIVEVPEFLYNHGELYNLGVPRGTLTVEERFKINEHIIQTILMLEALPFPRSLARVPEIAGGHHETMAGTGYPRRLRREDMSVQARILAIADIFEALTASDRPYKRAKTLGDSLQILAQMRDGGHIDADLFDLFLVHGIHLTYGRRFLRPDQIEDVDITPLLSSAARGVGGAAEGTPAWSAV